MNGDGFDDLIVGAYGADPHGARSGTRYVIFGKAPEAAVLRTGTASDNAIRGGAFNDTLQGLSGNDSLFGNAGNDRLDGGTGADVLIGGLGNDIYITDGGDTITEGLNAGTDTVRSSVRLTLGANLENLVLTGSSVNNGIGNALNNALTSNGGANRLNGGAGSDTLSGGAGNDRLTGGTGQDRLTGGLGADTFVFRSVSESGPTYLLRDKITDFQHLADKIDLSAIDARSAVGGDQAFTFIGAAAFSAAGQLRYSGAIFSEDVNGNGIADFSVLLTGNPILTAADFLL